MSGPNLTVLGVTTPETRSDFWMTHVSCPVNVVGPVKSFQETTTLSVLPPVKGWSPMMLAALVTRYTFQDPAGSEVTDTAINTWPPLVELNERPDRNHREL